MKYIYSKMSQEISGFGGDYEEACRTMVIEGMKWLDLNPDADVSYDQFNNVYGLTANESNDCKILQDTMDAAIGGGCSGAMMQAALGHVMFAHTNGWDAYMEKMTIEGKTEN